MEKITETTANPQLQSRFTDVDFATSSYLGNTTTIEATAAEVKINHHVPVPVHSPSIDEGHLHQNSQIPIKTNTYFTGQSYENARVDNDSKCEKDDHVPHNHYSHDKASEDTNDKNFVHHDTKKRRKTVLERKEDSAASTTFPQHLMDAIEQESLEGKPSVLDWVDGGSAFVIHDKEAFERNVLPKYFDRGINKKCKFMSFVRKLYRWGFRQVIEKASLTSMTFTHPNFIRGNKQRCLRMRSIVKRPVGIILRKQSSCTPHQRAGQVLLQQQAQEQGVAVAPDIPEDVPLARPLATTSALSSFGSSSALYFCQQQPSILGTGAGQQIAVPHLGSVNLQDLAFHHGLNYYPSSSLHRFSTTTTPSDGFQSSMSSEQHDDPEWLERLARQRRQELVQQILSGRISDYGGAADRMPAAAIMAMPHHLPLPSKLPLPTGPPAPVIVRNPASTSFGYHHSTAADFVPGRHPITGHMRSIPEMVDTQVVELASQMMKSNPRLEPWRALDLAKKCLSQRDNGA